MSIKVVVSTDDGEVLDTFRVVCLEGENNATANDVKELVSRRYDVDETED